MAFDLRSLEYPIVQAPMAGGPSTPALAAAVGKAGGLGFLAAGYKTPEGGGRRHRATAHRERTKAPFGVNLFIPPTEKAVPQVVAAYAQTLTADAERHGVTLGDPRFDDDAYAAKLELVIRERVPLASFTFGSPAPETVTALHEHGIAVWVTVTTPRRPRSRTTRVPTRSRGPGTEAGGHRAYFSDAGEHEGSGLLVLLRVLHTRPSPPLVATGGLMDGAGIAAALVAGASAVQLGSAFLLTPEAERGCPASRPGGSSGITRLTRAFSGRTARGIVNRFMDEHDADAPSAYPQVHHLTSPLRAAARGTGDADAINLWAGQGHAHAQARPAGEIVRTLAADAAQALADGSAGAAW